jgi:hypothetical protein
MVSMLAFIKRPWVMALLLVGVTLYFRDDILGLLPSSVKKFLRGA